MRFFLGGFASSLIFGLGLGLAGMTQPQIVLSFLDITGHWNPSLALVMVSAVMVHILGYRLVRKRKSPLMDSKFHVPDRRVIDVSLVLGSSLFGIGWGLTGLCPGPTLVAATGGNLKILLQLAGFICGVFVFRQFRSWQSSRTITHPPKSGQNTIGGTARS